MRNTNDTLHVWYQDKLVGALSRDSAGLINFQYEPAWLQQGFAISQQLPLQTECFKDDNNLAHLFFANLLPEGDARTHIVRDLKITNSDFELLKAVGGECAGALSILPMDKLPATENKYNQLSVENLTKILLRKGIIFNFKSQKERPRLSLAGAQDKCPVFYDNQHYFLPEGAAPSSHILKFEITGYRNIPLYEYYLTKLAKAVSLPVVDVILKQQEEHSYLLIKRYDRHIKTDGNIERLHQEDFCQALGVSYEKKYEADGGPGFLACYELLQKISTQPIHDLEHLLRWQIFNVLAGNSDGHAKNLSLLYDNQQNVRLAPFYDLVCTRAIERIDTNLAFAIGNEFNPDKLTAKHWALFAASCKVRESYLFHLLKDMASLLLELVSSENEEFKNDEASYPALQRLKLVINKQCSRVLKQLDH